MLASRAAPQRGFLFVFVVLGVVAVVSSGCALRWPLLVTKPVLAPALAMFLLVGPTARRMVIPFGIGLLFATAGDVVLLQDHPSSACVLAGIALFLGMHISYTFGFLHLARPAMQAIFAYVAVLGLIAVLLWHQLPDSIRPTGVVYAAVLCAMATTASALGRGAALGGALFVVSDFLLALTLFAPFFAETAWRDVGQLLVMGTYVSAQGLLIVGVQRSLSAQPSTASRSTARLRRRA